jgi:hypothetical protein
VKKKLISYFLLLLVGIQFLPVKELGQALFKSQAIEEISEQITPTKDAEEKQAKKSDEIAPQDHASYYFGNIEKNSHFIQNVSYFFRNLDDIPTPPPLFRF